MKPVMERLKTLTAAAVVLFSLGLVGQAAPPSVQLRVEVDPREVTIGDHIRYRLTVNYSSHVAPAPIALPDPFGEFVLLDYNASAGKALTEGKMVQNISFFSPPFLPEPKRFLRFN